MTIELTTADAVGELGSLLRGRVIDRSDPEYEEARSVFNGMIDKFPLAVARCADVADVVAAVNWAREHDVIVAVRGGGHSGPGLGTVDDGLVIDLSAMRGIRVDPVRRTVRVEAGCTAGDVDHATHAYGLAVPFGIVASTGVAGLTLGGGTGYLTRQYGLTVDNLLEADVVLADGRIVTADESTNADLFWALRGGGGNFGVVVSFLFQAHPVDQVFAGPVFFDLADARTVARAYRDFLPDSPVELATFFGLKTVPAGDPFPAEHRGKHACALITCFSGTAEAGAAALAPLMDLLPEPLFDWRGEMPFPALNQAFDPLFPKGLQCYWRGDFVRDLPDEAIEAHIEQAGRIPPGAVSLMHLYPIDGAVHRVGRNDTAWNTRDTTWNMVILGAHPDPDAAAGLEHWVRDYWDAVHPFSDRGGYVNFMMTDESPDRLRATYGDNLERLARVKAAYDPDNFFRVNQNIAPTSTAA
jgi:FAD/FMN-containing dehydrogenase